MGEERTGLSRRQLFGASAAVAVAAALGRAAPRAIGLQVPDRGAAGGATEELILVNGRIHTMDRNDTIANTVSIRNSRFSAVAGAFTRRPGARVIDLRGRTVVPGIIDNHNHIVLMGKRRAIVSIEVVKKNLTAVEGGKGLSRVREGALC